MSITDDNVIIGTSGNSKFVELRGNAGANAGFTNVGFSVKRNDPTDLMNLGVFNVTDQTIFGVNEAGQVGINTTPGTYATLIRQQPGFGFGVQDNAQTHLYEYYILNSGNFQLYKNGSLRGTYDQVSGAYTSVSDRRLKTNITPLDGVLDKIMKLKPSSYTFVHDRTNENQLGFIAQQVEPIFPELVTLNTIKDGSETQYTMNYAGFGIVAIAAIQEQQEIIDAQKETIEDLEARMEKMEALVNKLVEKQE